jgi:uncharacterized protein (DUF169 family)
MKSRIAEELKLRRTPVAILFMDEKPKGALQFKEGKRGGCVIAMLSAAARGKTAVFDRKTAGCRGGGVGLEFGNTYGDFPGGIEYFLSTGRGEGYREGEGYRKTVELARQAIAEVPFTNTPYTYVVFKPLEQVNPATETPRLVVFLANPDQLSALVVLANYGRPGSNNVTIPVAAGCQTICLLPDQESRSDHPRAVVGITDISARPRVDADLLSFTVPFKLFLEMEADVPGSFLEKPAWRRVKARIPDVALAAK